MNDLVLKDEEILHLYMLLRYGYCEGCCECHQLKKTLEEILGSDYMVLENEEFEKLIKNSIYGDFI